MTESGMDLGPASLLGAVMVSARSRSGREWDVYSFNASSDEYLLYPRGDDVQPATDGHGHMQGGVRRIWVHYEDLHNGDKWRLIRRGRSL